MFSLDMTGEDVTKTGGSFLVERYPDPGAVWDRPWDPHTEWGRGNVRADSLKGDLINDVHFAVIERVARKSKWVVKTNPYEGGSDHTVFGTAGVPSVLDWHFTDRYYHTNFDTPDKTSPDEMRNVGVAVGATAWLFASADESRALELANVVASAGKARISREETEGATLPDHTALLAAWKKWNAEAVRSASRVVLGPPSPGFAAKLDALAGSFAAGSIDQTPFRRLPPGSPALKVVSSADQAPAAAKENEKGTDKFVCGTDARSDPIPLSWQTVVLAGDSRLYQPCPQANHAQSDREVQQGILINQAMASPDPEIRWRGAQAMVRLERGIGAVLRTAVVRPACNAEAQIFGGLDNPMRWQPGELFTLVTDRYERVRREAAFGIGLVLSRPGLDANVATAARKEILACVERELTLPTGSSTDVVSQLLQAIGVTRYGTDQVRAAAASYLTDKTKPRLDRTGRLASDEVTAAVYGLEALIRQSPGWNVAEPVRVRLRDIVVHDQPGVVPRAQRLAMMALQAARDADSFTLELAANQDDFQVRRLVAMSLNLSDPNHARIGERLARDGAFQVRYEYLAALNRLSGRTHECAPLTKFLDDPEPTVVLRAMDLINPQCTDLDDAVTKLLGEAKKLEKDDSQEHWHVPSRALTALTRVRPEEAKPLLAFTLKYPVWQVRAAAAAPLVNLGLIDEAVQLARDPKPNVQTAAIEALTRAKRMEVLEPALEVLSQGLDFQVMRAAANAMVNVPDDRRDDATDKLLIAMRRLTLLEEDPSRDPRVAILAALGRVMRPDRANDLIPFLADLDDAVNEAAAKAYQNITGAVPPRQTPARRYPYQPKESALNALPIQALFVTDAGEFEVDFRKDVAPVTLARFTMLVNAGYYDGLTFHRIAPNFVVQGGSPGASEYVGASRYMRDEVSSASHLMGALGISTRGHDTGDAQIFIDLVDVPRLDRDYTVFGYVTRRMDIVSTMLEGTVIKAIRLRYR